MLKRGWALLVCDTCGAEYEDAPRSWCGDECDHCRGHLVEEVPRLPVRLAHDHVGEKEGVR